MVVVPVVVLGIVQEVAMELVPAVVDVVVMDIATTNVQFIVVISVKVVVVVNVVGIAQGLVVVHVLVLALLCVKKDVEICVDGNVWILVKEGVLDVQENVWGHVKAHVITIVHLHVVGCAQIVA